MKKIAFAVCCICFMIISGCGEDHLTPEDFGKDYVEKKFSGLNCNLEDLDYTVTEEGDDIATVEIEGKIKYKEKIFLVKKNEKWILASEAAKLNLSVYMPSVSLCGDNAAMIAAAGFHHLRRRQRGQWDDDVYSRSKRW